MRHIVLSSVAILALSLSVIGCGGGKSSNNNTNGNLTNLGDTNGGASEQNRPQYDDELKVTSGNKIITGLNANYSYEITSSNSNIFEILDGDQYTDANGNPIKVLAFKESPVDGEYVIKLKISNGDDRLTKTYKIVVGTGSSSNANSGAGASDNGNNTENNSTSGNSSNSNSGTTVTVLTFSVPTMERVSQSDAAKQCASPSFLPTLQQLLDNKEKVWNAVKDIDSDANSSNGVSFNSVVWANDPNKGLWFKDGVLANAQEYEAGDNDTYYVVCATESESSADDSSSSGSNTTTDDNSGDNNSTTTTDSDLITVGNTQWLKIDPALGQMSWSDARDYCQNKGMELPTKEDAKALLVGYSDVNGTFSDFNKEVLPESISSSVVWLEEDDPGLSAWALFLGNKKFISYSQENTAYVSCVKK